MLSKLGPAPYLQDGDEIQRFTPRSLKKYGIFRRDASIILRRFEEK